MTAPKLIAEPRGHRHRVSMARHRPEALTLQPCDVACLLDISLSAVYVRDRQLRPAWLGVRTRRYSWANYTAYVASVAADD